LQKEFKLGKMKAAIYTQYGPPEVLQIVDIPRPEPKKNEILVKIHAALVASGDIRMRNMNLSDIRYFERKMARLVVGYYKPKRKILGMGLSGEIVSIGHDVTRFSVGNKIVAGTWKKMQFGAYAEYICIREDGVIAIKPEKLDFQDALSVVGGISALSFLRKGNIENCKNILIYGASGAVGTTAVQLGKHFKTKITAVCSGNNTELVKLLGADFVIDYTKEDFTKNNTKYDLIFDAVGKINYKKISNLLTENGKFISVITSGHAASGIKEMEYLLRLAENGELKPVTDKVYPLDQIVEAHRYVERGHKVGNVLIQLC